MTTVSAQTQPFNPPQPLLPLSGPSGPSLPLVPPAPPLLPVGDTSAYCDRPAAVAARKDACEYAPEVDYKSCLDDKRNHCVLNHLPTHLHKTESTCGLCKDEQQWCALNARTCQAAYLPGDPKSYEQCLQTADAACLRCGVKTNCASLLPVETPLTPLTPLIPLGPSVTPSFPLAPPDETPLLPIVAPPDQERRPLLPLDRPGQGPIMPLYPPPEQKQFPMFPLSPPDETPLLPVVPPYVAPLKPLVPPSPPPTPPSGWGRDVGRDVLAAAGVALALAVLLFLLARRRRSVL